MTLAIWPRPRLRLGMVGGGLGGNIGTSHRTAALMDGRWDLVAGALSRDADRARASAAAWQIAPDRAYTDYAAMAKAEAARPDGIDAVTICTPNSSHHPIAMAFLAAGIHVICDKPLTVSPALADELLAAARTRGRVFAVTHTYSGYPMVRMAREMIAAGELGTIRSCAVEYASQYQAEPAEPDDWQNDPAVSGPLGIVAGTGTHAHHLIEFVTGARVVELSADLATLVPGHRLEDHATMHLRFDNGARGYLWNTTVACGNENGLAFRVYGEKGGLAWRQEHPNHLFHSPLRAPTRILTRGGFGAGPAAEAVSRVPAGHPEGYLEAFANLYAEIADAVLAAKTGAPPPAAPFPTVEDGARGVRFMFAARASAKEGSRFVALDNP